MTMLRSMLVFFVLGSCNAQTPSLKTNKDENSLLWQISGNGLKKSSYLFGTFHLVCKTDLHFSEQLKTSLKSTEEVYLELDMDDPTMLFNSLTMMTMRDGKRLKDLYTAEEYKKIEAYFKDSLQMPLTLLQTMKPILLGALMYPKMLPCKTSGSIEEALMEMAKTNKQEIKGLETMAFQASIFDSIPYEEQAKDLLRSIDSAARYKEYFIQMLYDYKAQKIKALEDMIKDSTFSETEYNDILLDKRNKNWISQLKVIMKKEAVFVAVGAGHLVGGNGLIALLRKEGYKLVPIENR